MHQLVGSCMVHNPQHECNQCLYSPWGLFSQSCQWGCIKWTNDVCFSKWKRLLSFTTESHQLEICDDNSCLANEISAHLSQHMISFVLSLFLTRMWQAEERWFPELPVLLPGSHLFRSHTVHQQPAGWRGWWKWQEGIHMQSYIQINTTKYLLINTHLCKMWCWFSSSVNHLCWFKQYQSAL